MNSESITPAWEPHGLALEAWWNGEDDVKVTILTGEAQDAVELPVGIYFRMEEDLPGVEAYALDLCRGKVLDVGAGAGSHCLLLEDRGLEATGLDISPRAVRVMEERGVEHTLCGSFLDLSPNGTYDTLLFLMNGIGVAGDLEGLAAFLTHAHQWLSRGGQLILDSSDLKAVGMEGHKDASYYGVVYYQMEFQGTRGAPYFWLYVDERTLARTASETGWDCQIVYKGGEGAYLARLVKREGI